MFKIIIAFIKAHAVAIAITTTVVVSTVIATPIVINQVQKNKTVETAQTQEENTEVDNTQTNTTLEGNTIENKEENKATNEVGNKNNEQNIQNTSSGNTKNEVTTKPTTSNTNKTENANKPIGGYEDEIPNPGFACGGEHISFGDCFSTEWCTADKEVTIYYDNKNQTWTKEKFISMYPTLLKYIEDGVASGREYDYQVAGYRKKADIQKDITVWTQEIDRAKRGSEYYKANKDSIKITDQDTFYYEGSYYGTNEDDRNAYIVRLQRELEEYKKELSSRPNLAPGAEELRWRGYLTGIKKAYDYIKSR